MRRVTNIPFRPFAFLRNRHAQTVLAHFWRVPWTWEPPSELQTVDLPDGDRLAMLVSTPPGWESGTTVALVHGLAGSEQSVYMVRQAEKLLRRGVRAVRVNLRGCGRGYGLARKCYSSGCSDDIRAVAEVLRAQDPKGSLVIVGFSLGANIVLKLAGELGRDGGDLVDQFVVFAPPANLSLCVERILSPENRAYERQFVKEMREETAARRAVFPEANPVELPPSITLPEFDDVYTGPQWGFADAADYYEGSSSAPLVPSIRTRTRIVLARDDPVISPGVLDGVTIPEDVTVHWTDHGGHLGFLGRPGANFHWMDAQLLRWI